MKKISLFLLAFCLAVVSLAADEVTVSGSNGQDGVYSTLTAESGAFAALNAADQTGKSITIALSASTTGEDGNHALTGANGMWARLTIYPTVEGVTLFADVAKPLIDLNGADNVTINGAVNNTGSARSMVIANTNNTNTAGTSTIRFINDATGNVVKNCIIKGATTDGSAGVVFFSTGAVTGNDNNLIENNDITNAGNSGAGTATERPIQAIYSAGTAMFDNSGIVIRNNNIFNTLRFGTTSNMILLGANTTACTISGNSFYETVNYLATASVNYSAIYISSTTGNGFVVNENHIGGQSALCAGNAWTKTGNNNTSFTGIYLNVGSEAISSIQNNKIQNINFANNNNANFKGIEIVGTSLVSIGDIAGNTIRDISWNNGGNGGAAYGINITTTGIVECQNNTITNINTYNNAGTNGVHIYGIQKTSVGGRATINNNTITNLTANSTSTGQLQSVFGINCLGTGVNVINGNVISQLDNKTSNATSGTAGVVNGIVATGGTGPSPCDISDNRINDLTIANANNLSTSQASAIGLVSKSGYAKVQRNTIYNVSNTRPDFAGFVVGMHIENNKNEGAETRVAGNFIYNITNGVTTAETGTIIGLKILILRYGPVYNNIISLNSNSNSTMYGIYENFGGSYCFNNIYFNTVYIAGNPTSGISNSATFFSDNTSQPNTWRDIRNNIFYNARSNNGATGSHYAAFINHNFTAITLNYNNYYVSGQGGVLGRHNGLDVTALPLIAGQDANSAGTDPGIANPGTTPDSYKGTSALAGVSITAVRTSTNGTTPFSITTDFAGTARTTPTMGAFQVYNITTGLNPQNQNTGSIRVVDNGILCPANARVEVITFSGKSVWKGVAGNRTISLPQGAYIVKAFVGDNPEITRVIVK